MKNVPLHENMGSKVLERLSQLADFRREGFVAGQAVASAVSELFGDGCAVVYNDVDVFRPVTDAEEADYQKVSEEHHKKVSYSPENPGARYFPLNNLCSFTTPNHWTDQYSHLHFSCLARYEVRKTYRNGMLNEIACSEMPEDGIKLLETFDMNAVQVAVDLKTERLIWTPAFEKFHQSRQLDITSLHTPFHSLVRYFRKMRELSGVYGNKERIIQMVGLAYHLGRESGSDATRKVSTFNLRWKFGEMYKAKFDEVADELLPHFEVIQLATKTGQIYTLKPRFEAQEDLVNLAQRGPIHIVHDVPLISRALYEKRRKGVQECLSYLVSAKETFTRACWITHGEGYVCGNVTAKEMRQFDKAVANHFLLQSRFVDMKLDAQLKWFKVLQSETEKRGGWVYGVVEKSRDWRWEQEFITTALDEAKVRLLKVLKPETLAPVHLGSWRAEELTTGMQLYAEGSEMHHCVAGYAEAVESGWSAIVSLRCGPSPQEWLTLELRRSDEGWRKAQLRGLQNRSASESEKKVAAEYIDRYNLAFYLGRYGQFASNQLPEKWTKFLISKSAKLKSKSVREIAKDLRNDLLRVVAKKLSLPYYARSDDGTYHYTNSCKYWQLALTSKVGRKLEVNVPKTVWSDMSEDDCIPF